MRFRRANNHYVEMEFGEPEFTDSKSFSGTVMLINQ